MNYKNLKDWNSGLVHRIIKRHPNGFIGGVIQGERGKGKSMYAYKVMAKTYMELEGFTSESEAYAMALNHMIFSPRDLIELIKNNIKNDYITPVICLDDATVHFSSYKFFVDLYEVILLKGMFDTIRTALTGLLMTCPSRRLLLSFLRDYDDFKISILTTDSGYWQRIARCYQFNWYPDDRKYKVIVPFQDKYSCYVPDEYFDPYMDKRKKYLEFINNRMEKLMEKKLKERTTSVTTKQSISS